MLQVVVSENKIKIKKQIQALESLIRNDNEKDRQIHIQTLNDLKIALNKE